MAGAGARRRSVRRTIGPADGLAAKSLAAAKDEAWKVAKDGPQGFGDDGSPTETLRELFDSFERFNQTSPEGLAAQTLKNYRRCLSKDVFPTLGHVPLNELTAKDFARCLTTIEQRSPKIAHECRSALGSTYKWAIKRLLVDVNPFNGMGFIHQGKPRDRLITDDEIARLWQAIDSKEFGATKEMRLLLKLAIITGQRNSEVGGARRSELHIGPTMANPCWQIPRSRMKRKKGRLDQFVFLSPQAAALFQEALDLAGPDSDVVFPAQPRGRHSSQTIEHEHIGQQGTSRAWARLRVLAKVKDANLHDVRKALVTYLDERGERSDILDRILDHAVGHHSGQRNSVTESHYVRSVLADPLRKAWARWADHVDAVVAGKRENADNVIPIQRTAS
jgi:integrase